MKVRLHNQGKLIEAIHHSENKNVKCYVTYVVLTLPVRRGGGGGGLG